MDTLFLASVEEIYNDLMDLIMKKDSCTPTVWKSKLKELHDVLKGSMLELKTYQNDSAFRSLVDQYILEFQSFVDESAAEKFFRISNQSPKMHLNIC